MSRPWPTLDVLVARFWAGISVRGPNECWPWTKARNKETRYGVMNWYGKTRGTHCISWEIHNGPIPLGAQVLHRCDNRPCGNPSHLFLGDSDANNKDMFAKGRGKIGKKYRFRGEEHHVAEWARKMGLLQATLLARLKSGWSIRKAMLTKARKAKPRLKR